MHAENCAFGHQRTLQGQGKELVMRALIVVALVAPVAGFGYFPADHTVYEGYFWCYSTLNAKMGEASEFTSIHTCWAACLEAYPDSLVSADLWTTGAESGCWCQDDCSCVATHGLTGGEDGSIALAQGWDLPGAC